MLTRGRRLGQGGRKPPEAGSASDDDLLQAIAAGDRAAFKGLMERHARPMLAMATRVLGNPDDADEIVQEGFLKVWTMAPKWRADGAAEFRTWLYRVVMNLCLDRTRKRSFLSLDEAGDPADDGPGGLELAMAKQGRSVVGEALDEMPARQRQALALYYFSDLSAPEASKVLGLSVSALEALLVRGKRSLRVILSRRGITGMGDV